MGTRTGRRIAIASVAGVVVLIGGVVWHGHVRPPKRRRPDRTEHIPWEKVAMERWLFSYQTMFGLATAGAITVALIWLVALPVSTTERRDVLPPLRVALALLLATIIVHLTLAFLVEYMPAYWLAAVSGSLGWIELFADALPSLVAPVFLLMFVWRLRRLLMTWVTAEAEAE